MSSLEMSFVERVFILIGDRETGQADEVEVRLSIDAAMAESRLRSNIATPVTPELTPSTAREAFWPTRRCDPAEIQSIHAALP